MKSPQCKNPQRPPRSLTMITTRKLRSGRGATGCAPFGQRRGVLTLALFFFSAASIPAQQQPAMPGMQMQHEHSDEKNALEFPRLGRAQANANPALFTLDQALEAARQ